MKVNILGSCYTRELFNYSSDYEVNCYVLQQSIFTMFEPPFKIEPEDAKSVDKTSFTDRMMFYEFNKLGLPKIVEAEGDCLIIDFSDCRYDIYEIESPVQTKIIYTHNARATFDHLETKPEYGEIKRKYVNVVECFTDDKLEIILKKLCNELLKRYKPQNIILHKVDMAKFYYENGEKRITVSGESAAILIGHHGETLDSLQYLASLAANKRVDGKSRSLFFYIHLPTFLPKPIDKVCTMWYNI